MTIKSDTARYLAQLGVAVVAGIYASRLAKGWVGILIGVVAGEVAGYAVNVAFKRGQATELGREISA